MRKIQALLMLLLCVAAFTACGNKEQGDCYGYPIN